MNIGERLVGIARVVYLTLRNTLAVFLVIDSVAIAAYFLLPLHSAELSETISNPLGILTHMFSHVSTWHVIGNSVGLLVFTVAMTGLGYEGALVMDAGDQFLSFVKRWTVPLFFAGTIASGLVAYLGYTAEGRVFSVAGMSDGVYCVATGLAFVSFTMAFDHLKLGRPLPTALRVITIILLFYVFYAIVNTSLDNLGHMLGVLSGTTLVTAADLGEWIAPLILAAGQGRKLSRRQSISVPNGSDQ
jgi:membrane associated rhomboid family serine protease